MGVDHLPPHIGALLEPGVLASVAPDLIQTNISYVLLTHDRAYKLKKAVNFGFLNYSTLQQRRDACEAEIALNRRLTDGVYLGVQSVTRTGDRYRLGDDGEVVDHAVVMRRLPAAAMMDRLVEQDAVTPAMLVRLARHLAAFYADAPAGERISTFAEPEAILANWQENFAQTLAFVGRTLGRRGYLRMVRAVYTELLRLQPLWRQRIAEGRTRDGHGDLRCSAVCFEDATIQVYDCIEFNDRFRNGDVAADVAFLAMDLDSRGRPDLADEFIAAFVSASGDHTLPAVLPFYQCYRAYVRGKVDSFQLDEAEVPPAQRRAARAAARRRFALAAGYARRQPLTMAVVMGDDATERDAVAAVLAARLGAVLLPDGVPIEETGPPWLRRRISVTAATSAGTGDMDALASRYRSRLLAVVCGRSQPVAGALMLPAGRPLHEVLTELHRRLGLVPMLPEPDRAA